MFSIKRKIIKVSVFVVIVLGFLFVNKLWPDTNKLPIIQTIESVELESVYTGGIYNFDSNKIKLVAFFYSRCPDICPMTMQDLKMVQSQLKDLGLFATEVELVAVTLDPEVDTARVLKTYGDAFGVDPSGWLLGRASLEKTSSLAEQFKMIFKKEESGAVLHGTTMYLLDRNNAIRSKHDMASGKEKVNVELIIANIDSLINEE